MDVRSLIPPFVRFPPWQHLKNATALKSKRVGLLGIIRTIRVVLDQVFRILFTRLIIVFGAMYITIVGLRTVKNTGSLLPLSSWSSCRGKILGSGSHRNFGTLPTHYILPSGDRIPSIALGAAVTIQYQILLLLIILTKVYGRLIRAK